MKYRPRKREVVELTAIINAWAKRRKVLKQNQRMVISITVEDVPKVVVQMLKPSSDTEKLDQLLALRISELGLPYRIVHCMENANHYLLGDVVREPEIHLYRIRNFGKRSSNQCKAKLNSMGLQMGMSAKRGPLEQEARLNGDLRRYFPIFSEWSGLLKHLIENGIGTPKAFLTSPSVTLRVMTSHYEKTGIDTDKKYDEIIALFKVLELV